MKRFLLIFTFLFTMFTVGACGTPQQKSYDYNGDWYSTKDGYLYVFNDGSIFCSENYVTLDSGKKSSGAYTQEEGCIDAYVVFTYGSTEFSPLYPIQGKQTDMLCSDMEGTKIIFCRDRNIAQQILQQKENSAKQKAEQEAKEEKNSIYTAPTVTYDSAISGNYTYQFVGIEGFVTSYEYSDFINWYNIDFWCWSDKEDTYVCKRISLDADEYSDEDIEHLQKFDNGDKVKFVFKVRSDFRSGDWIDIPQYLFAELIEKGEISESELYNDTENANESSTGISTADTTDIAVRFETDYIDGDRLHITVFTKNNSEETFVGNVYVTFYSVDGKDRLGSDTIIVDELLPGRESWADIIVDAYRGTPKMTVDFSEVSFTPIKEVVSEIDLDATEKTKSSYYWNFDGVSWYNDITDIAVYENGTCVVVLKDNPKEGGQFYAATIWGVGNDHGVNTVQVIDKNCTILAVYGSDGNMVSVTLSDDGTIITSSSTENQTTDKVENISGDNDPCKLSIHNWNNGQTTKQATCTSNGTKIYTCLDCSEQKNEIIPKINHSWNSGIITKNSTCSEVGTITYTCSSCNNQYREDVTTLPHTWDSGTITKNPTCTVEGIRAYNCTSCNASTTESIPTVAHSFTNQIVDDKYLCENATFTTGTKYYYSCFCSAKGSETFSLDNRRTWISWHEIVTDYDYVISYLDNNMSEKPYIRLWNNQIQFVINNVPRRFDITNEKIYIGDCNGCSIQFKYDETQYDIRYSNQDCYFFYYDDLVAAGIFE